MTSYGSRNDAIYVVLRRAILEQQLRPGAKLPEDSIGETFGVSRTSVRGALVRLSVEGLVDMKPNRGASVALPSLEEAIDVFDMRRCLENEVVRRLCQRMPKDGFDVLASHLQEEDRAARSFDSRSIRLAGEFHILLAELTHSKSLIAFTSQIVSRCSLILARFGRPHSAECGLEEHHRIVEALKAQDAELACRIMDAHLGLVQSRAELGQEASEPDITSILGRYIAEIEA